MEKNDSFERPAAFWLTRAKHAEAYSGDFRRAAVMERHALQAEPENDDVCMSYALTLQHMGCFEASNREAFAALARGSRRMGFYGVIGQNLMAMGDNRAALDAMDMYLGTPLDPSAEWVTELREQIAKNNRYVAAARNGKQNARHQAPSRREQRPAEPSPALQTAVRELCRAESFAGRGDAQRAQIYVQNALAQCPRDASVLVTAAHVLSELGLRAKACTLLTQAALYARTPSDQLLVCQLSDGLRQPGIALAMLTRAQRHAPNRFPVCHNLAVALCRVGRVEEALRYAHLCREIDPNDLEGQWMFECLNGLTQGGGAQPCYWGAPSPDVLNALALPVLLSRRDGTLARDLQTDAGIRRRFVYLLEQPGPEGLALLESAIREGLPAEPLRRLLRETLLRTPDDTPVKRYALRRLAELQKEPFPMWDGDRFRMVHPAHPQEVYGK